MIKKFYLLAICVFSIGSLFSQPNEVKKIWAWEFTSISGAQIDPSMGVEQPKNIYHLVYIEIKPKLKIENITIWCKNSFVYAAQTKAVTKYPVKFNRKEILIKKNKNNLLECVLNKIDVLLTPQKILTLFKLNEMVIEYSVNGKTYYSGLKTVPKKTEKLL